MLQPKNIKKQKSNVWRDFSILDFIVGIGLFILAALIGYLVPPQEVSGWIKIVVTVALFLIFSTLLAKSTKYNCRLYVLVFRMILFWFRSKRYGKTLKTTLLIPYDGIILDNIVKTKFIKDGVKYFSVIKFNGKSPWAEDEVEAQSFLAKFINLLDSIGLHISIVRTKELLNYEENFECLAKNKKQKIEFLHKSKADEKIIDSWKQYYNQVQNDFEALDTNLYVDTYYFIVYEKSINDLNKSVENLISTFNNMDLDANRISKHELLNFLANMNHKSIDETIANAYFMQQQVKYASFATKNKEDVVLFDDFASKFYRWMKNVFSKQKNNLKNVVRKTNTNDANLQKQKELKLDELLSSNNVVFKANHFIKDNKYYSIQLVADLPIQLFEGWAIPVFDNNSKIVWNLGAFTENQQASLLDKTNKKLDDNVLTTKSKYRVKSHSIQMEALEYLENQLQVNGNTLFNSWLLVINEADSLKELKKIEQNNYMIAKRQKIILNPLPFKQFEAYAQTCLIPSINIDEALQMSSHNIAYGWAFENERNNDGNLFVLGETINTGEPIIFNQFYKKSSRRVNYNMFTLGSSGKGKSTDVKKAILGHLAENNNVYVIDVQNEYKKLAKNFNGVRIDLGTGFKTVINPLEIQVQLNDDDDEEYSAKLVINKHCEWLEEFFKIAVPDLSVMQLQIILESIKWIYKELGIYDLKHIEDFKKIKYPIITDVINTLEQYKYVDSYEKNRKREIVDSTKDRLEFLFMHNGKYEHLYNGVTNINLDNDFIVFNTQQLFITKGNDTASGKVGLFILLSYIQNKIYNNYLKDKTRNSLIVIDELHVYIDPDNISSLNFVYTMTKTVRKFNAGMILCTQNPSDFLGSTSITSKAQAILQNCQYAKFFGLKQKDLDAVIKMYKSSGGLNDSQTHFLADSEIGNMLFSLHMYNKTKARVYYNQYEEDLFFTKGRIGSDWNGANE